MAEKDSETKDDRMEKIVSLCKRRGFVFQGSEIYGGLKGFWDYGPLGVLLKRNIEREWWKMFVTDREDMYGLDAAILMNEKVWEASGHTGAGFSDPVVVCPNPECNSRWRTDQLIKTFLEEEKSTCPCPRCRTPFGTEEEVWNKSKQFNLMFETKVGVEGTQKSYLRPETAQGIFVNFKNVLDSMSPKIPFGIAQIGKGFRNEIAPREFLFRVREFDMMEIEYFVKEEEWQNQFENWREHTWSWFDHLGLLRENVKELEVPEKDLAHYSRRTIDFEYNFPGKGFDELSGLAYRTDFDLKKHSEYSGVNLQYVPADGEPFIPHVIEPTFGVGRTVLAVLSEVYTEDDMGEGGRVFLKLPVHLAPYRVAVSPLLKNKPALVAKAREVFTTLKKEFGNVAWDDNGNIGKRYRRQDEIGTPSCVVIDFETLGQEDQKLENTVTVRNRDSGEQARVAIPELANYLR